ncbi:MAG TPA: carbohydrate-binding family 9-like protein [Bryobacteraceae bacterium]
MLKVSAIVVVGIAIMGCANRTEAATFKSTHAAQDVRLEVNPQSAFWRDAQPVYFDTDNFGHPVPWLRTEVRSRWTKNNLYLLFECPYRQLYLKPSPHNKTETDGLWNWDVAEIFIGSNFQDIRRYKEFEISPQGEWVDLDINLDNPHRKHGWKWNSGFQVAARIDRKSKVWYGAMRIPFRAIEPNPPHSGTILRANLFRCQGPPPDRKLLAWQAPMSNTFHAPERFGQLELVNRR